MLNASVRLARWPHSSNHTLKTQIKFTRFDTLLERIRITAFIAIDLHIAAPILKAKSHSHFVSRAHFLNTYDTKLAYRFMYADCLRPHIFTMLLHKSYSLHVSTLGRLI